MTNNDTERMQTMDKKFLCLAFLIAGLGLAVDGCVTPSNADAAFPFAPAVSHNGMVWSSLVGEWVVPGSVKVKSEKPADEKTFKDAPLPPPPGQLKIFPDLPSAGVCNGPNCPLKQAIQGRACAQCPNGRCPLKKQ